MSINEEKLRSWIEQTDKRLDQLEGEQKPEEPKLEGEVREIVRHWANLQGYIWLKVGFTERETQRIFWLESTGIKKRIEFLGAYVADDLEAGKYYTIDELCGEEDE